jgi:hypothetical protein
MPSFGKTDPTEAVGEADPETRMSESPTIRPWILASVRRVLTNEPFTWADWESQPLDGWDEVEQPQKGFAIRMNDYPVWAAWIALRRWLDDADIRARDAEYSKNLKSGLQHLLELISNAE